MFFGMQIISSIVLPLKNQTLWSLHEEESVSILSTYYETCINCFLSVNDYQNFLPDFNQDFYNWLLQSVRGEMLPFNFNDFLETIH
jgi:hypothetical protein